MVALASKDPPRATPRVASLVLVSLPFVAAPAFIILAEHRGAQHFSVWPFLAAAAGALLVGAVLAPRTEHALAALVRRLLLGATFAAAPIAFSGVPPEEALALCAAFGGLAGALAAPDFAALARVVWGRATPGEGDRPSAPLPVLALVLAALTLLSIPAARPYLGAARTMILAALLVLAWTPLLFLSESGRGGLARALIVLALVLGGATAALAVNASRLRLPLPLPIAAVNRSLEPVEDLTPGARLWAMGMEAGAIVQVQTTAGLTLYEGVEEARIAEALIHPAAGLWRPRRALLLGDESGAATRELLKYASVERVARVSFVPGLTAAFRKNPILRRAHGGALEDPRVVHREIEAGADIAAALAGEGRFDLIVVAAAGPIPALKWLLGPAGRRFFLTHLVPGGALVRRLFSFVEPTFSWCFVQESSAAGWTSYPYVVTRPMSSADQILVELSSPTPFRAEELGPPQVATTFLTPSVMRKMSAFGRDEEFQKQERDVPCVNEIAP